MTDAESRDRRRTVFGEVADAYEAGRPAYPERLVDDVLAFAALDGAPALEVGAGTGKATVAFAERGVAVTCLEPDERMAALLARKVEAHRRVSVVISSLEQYDGLDQRFGLLYAAQSWHWVDPEKSWDLACQALRPGGALALFWNNILVPEGELNAALLGVYERHDSPALAEGTLQRPPAPALESTASKNLSADERFTDVSFPTYPWSHTFTTDSYLHYLRLDLGLPHPARRSARRRVRRPPAGARRARRILRAGVRHGGRAGSQSALTAHRPSRATRNRPEAEASGRFRRSESSQPSTRSASDSIAAAAAFFARCAPNGR